MKAYFPFLSALLLCAALGVALYLLLRERKHKALQQNLIASLQGKRYWRINLARPAFMATLLRLSQYEAKGVLIDEGEHAKIRCVWPNGAKNSVSTEYSVSKSQENVQWIGNKNMRSGNLHWAQLKTTEGNVLFSADTGMNALVSRQALEDIFRGAFPNYPLSHLETADFALEKNPRSLLAMLVLFALLAFSLIDTFFISTFELIESQMIGLFTSPYLLFIIPVALGGITFGLYCFFIKGKVPARESWVLSSFLTGILLFSAFPVAKRADQLLAAPSQDYAYRIIKGVNLEPVDENLNLPMLRFPKSREYLAQFDEKTEIKVPLLRGPMGLWQLDHTKFDKPIIEFYKNKKKQ